MKPSGILGRRKWLILGGGIGFAALAITVVVIAGIVWMGNVVEKEQAVGGPSEAVAAARPAVAPTAPIEQRTLMPAPTIDSADWKVRADPIPLADDLLNSVPIDQSFNTKRFCFSDPTAGKVLLAESTGLQRIDLRTGERKSLLSKPTPDSRAKEHAAISPSGERFAAIGSELKMLRDSYSLEVRSCGDGISIGTMPIERKSYDTSEAIYFLDENRILHYQSGQLRLYDTEKSKLVFETIIQFKTTPQLTPGRKWIYGRTASGYAFYDTEGGKHAGSIKLDGPWRNISGSDFNVKSHLAVDSDGRRALLVAPIHTSVYLVSIDLAAGKVKESVLCDDIAHSSQLGMRATWASDRLIAFESGYIVDLSTKSLVMNYSLGNRTALTYSGYFPNRRTWHLQANKQIVSAQLPDPADVSAAVNFGPYPWPMGTPLRVEASGPGDVAHQTEAAEIVAKALAARGFPIDPNAKNRVTVVTGSIQKGTVSADATDAEVKKAARWNPKMKNNDPGTSYYKFEKGMTGDIVVEAVGADGKPSTILVKCHDEIVGYNGQRLLGRLRVELKSHLESGELDKPRHDPVDRHRLIGRDIPIKDEAPSKLPR